MNGKKRRKTEKKIQNPVNFVGNQLELENVKGKGVAATKKKDFFFSLIHLVDETNISKLNNYTPYSQQHG